MATILITGANRGIGLELTRQLTARGDHVLAVCRTPSDELSQTGADIVEGVDVTSDDDVAKLVDRVGDAPVDVLILNSGVLAHESLDDLDFDGIRHQLEVNALGPLRVTAALRHRLGKGSKVAIITSRMGSIADNGSGGYYGYRMSKAAVNMAGVSLAHDLRDQGVAVCILHPGFVRTRMTGNQGAVEPADAAKGLIARVDELTMERTGEFRHANGDALPW
jgi:NAD(P)-dependent dehydrogenase (short-subunit alcohol dehydrogenase family)